MLNICYILSDLAAGTSCLHGQGFGVEVRAAGNCAVGKRDNGLCPTVKNEIFNSMNIYLIALNCNLISFIKIKKVFKETI